MEIPTKFLLLLSLVMLLATFSGRAQQTTASPHGQLTIDIDCSACHTTGQWSPAREHPDFDHNTMTRFQLIGKHSRIDCQSCHFDLQFTEPKLSNEECAGCHVDVHRGRFTQNCSSCHNQEVFQVVDGRSVHSQTIFPLTGAHQQISCESCHTSDRHGAFAALDTDCFSCHEQDYNEAETIDHVAENFSTQCEECHSTLSWGGATFDHLTASGGFPLIGAHNQIECQSCHLIPGFATRFDPANENDCFACHQDDYNSKHTGSGFPTDCTVCHDVNSWDDAEFAQHDQLFFPIFSGRHRGLWDNCSTCHEVANNFTQFTCFNCHEHRQSEADAEHKDISGYVYDSQACLSCHSSGRAKGGD